jgi:hypothetical protein
MIGRAARRASIALVVVMAGWPLSRLEAHKPVTSKYTFADDVYPIVKEHCGACHVPGGIAPMSLMTFEDARPWAESIRLELTTGHMPPWYGDPGVAALRDVHKLSPRDIDVVLTWVTGGTPPGQPDRQRPVMKPAADATRRWPKGRPDLVLPLPAPVTLPADKAEDTREFVLRESGDRDRTIAFADLLPGNPAIVHDATIFTRRPGSVLPASVLAVWLPGVAPTAAGAGLGFPWHAGEQLVVRVHYKKNWKLENKTASDRSTIGLYLTKPPVAREIRGVALPLNAAHALDEHLQGLAVGAADAPSDVQVTLEAIRPDGSRVPVAGFLTRAGWDQRYWLERPVDLPEGTRIEVRTAGEPARALRLWLDSAPAPF